jgi:hypothetical protein
VTRVRRRNEIAEDSPLQDEATGTGRGNGERGNGDDIRHGAEVTADHPATTLAAHATPPESVAAQDITQPQPAPLVQSRVDSPAAKPDAIPNHPARYLARRVGLLNGYPAC